MKYSCIGRARVHHRQDQIKQVQDLNKIMAIVYFIITLLRISSTAIIVQIKNHNQIRVQIPKILRTNIISKHLMINNQC